MYKIFIYLFVLCLGVYLLKCEDGKINFDFHQNDYQVVMERMEVAHYNKKLMNRFQLKTFKYNRTSTAFNLTVNYKFDLNTSLEVVLQAYRFASNEYRYFPMRFQYNFCLAVSLNMFGYAEGLCGNFTKCDCEKEKTYHLCNWSPTQSKFPPYVPTGRYMLELQGFSYSTELWMVRCYGAVTRPFVK